MARLEGFTIVNARVICNGTTPTIEGNVFLGAASRAITSSSNPAMPGGPTIIGNVIRDRSSQSNGAGIGFFSTGGVVENNIIIGNDCTGDDFSNGSGGGIYGRPNGGVLVIRNNLICGNQASGGLGRGGGVFLTGGGFVVFEGNTLVGNYAEFAASGLMTEGGPEVEIRNSIFFGNTSAGPDSPIIPGSPDVSVQYSLVEGGWSDIGNIDADPMFVMGPLGDKYLHPMSPCVDAGDPSTPSVAGTTQADQSSDTGVVDMGFHYPFTPEFVRGDCNVDGVVDLSDSVFHLGSLFVPGSSEPLCESACDGNSDGVADVSDAVFTLSWLFIGGPAPAAPFPDCGIDPAAATASTECESFAACP